MSRLAIFSAWVIVESFFPAAISAGLAVGVGVRLGVDAGRFGACDVGLTAQPANVRRRRKATAATRAGRRFAWGCRVILPAYVERIGLSLG
jgi:hypothetical protein